MKLVVQRVNKAKVKRVADGSILGKIGKGYFVLVGIAKDDTEITVQDYAFKLSKLRVMADKNQKMNLSISDSGGSILVVSQFTLFADTSTGNRPSFVNAGDPEVSEKLYNLFIEKLFNLGIKVQTGSFGEYMKIEAELDGPVTIIY